MRTLSSDLQHLLRHLSLHGEEFPFPAAMVLSGAAFRHYFFNPAYNHAWLVEFPDDLWRNDTLFVENYGLHEAIEGHTGWASRRWHALKGVELVQLLRHEREEQRLLRLEATQDQPAGILRDFDVQRSGLTLEVERNGAIERIEHKDISTLDDFSATLPPMQSLRRAQDNIPDTRRWALTHDVLRWAPRHWQARKEIIYDVQAFYAAGDQAWIDLQAFHTQDIGTDSTRASDAKSYLTAHLKELHIARNAAAQFFADHAQVVHHTGKPLLSKRSTQDLAHAWQAAADAINRAIHALAHDAPSDATDATDALAQAYQQDSDAFAHFSAWTEALHRVTSTPK